MLVLSALTSPVIYTYLPSCLSRQQGRDVVVRCGTLVSMHGVHQSQNMCMPHLYAEHGTEATAPG